MKWIGIHGAAESGKDTAADFIIKSFGGAKVALADPMKRFCRGVLGYSQAQLWGPSENRNAPDPRFMGEERAATCHAARVRLREQGPGWVASVLPHFGPEKRTEALTALSRWLEACLRQEGLTARYALQTLGTEWGRAQDPDMWLHCADRNIEARDSEGYAVIPDCRFLNEGAFLQSKGAMLIEIVRPEHEGNSAMAAGVTGHQSEMERVQQAEAFKKYITKRIKNNGTLDTFKERLWGTLSPGVPWPEKPATTLLIEATSSIVIESAMDPLTSPSTSSIEEATPETSLPNTDDDGISSSRTPTDTPKSSFGSGPKTTPGKTGGRGQKIGRKT